MNWESIAFLKMYKTNKCKFNPPNYMKLTNDEKLDLYNNIINKIKEFNLNNPQIYNFGVNINVNKNCALYNLSPTNKNYYFSFQINNIFYFYNIFIICGRELIQNEIYLFKDKNILLLWEKYLFHLLFLKELNINLLTKEIKTNINLHFKYYCFILGNISYLDIILLSIIIDLDIYDEILKNNNLIYIKRWILSFNKIYNVDKNKIMSSFKSKEKENIYNTYRLTTSIELVKAVLSSDYDKVEYLLLNEKENVESRKEKDYKSLAHIACGKADKRMLLILLKYGCNINSLDYENMTPLYDAVGSNDINFVEYLIKDLKMNINHKEIQNRTPFYWACCKSNINMIKYIMSFPEVDINYPSLMGRTALSKACWNGQLEIVKLLCSLKTINSINMPDINNRCPIHNAVWGEFGGREGKKMPAGSPTDSPEIVQLLINNGAELEIKDNDGNTPFMLASSTNGIGSMKILMKYNINLNEVNNNHETGLIQASKYGYYESIQTFLEYYQKHLNNENNVDLNKADNDGYTPIDYSIIYKRVLCLKLFIENLEHNNLILKEKINQLINLSIQSQSNLCFKYLFRKIFYKYNLENDELLNIIKLLLIYENFISFNFLFDILSKEQIIILINIDKSKEILLYSLILEYKLYQKYDIVKEKEKSLNTNKEIKLSENERETIYEQILQKKMSILTNDEIKLINEDFIEEKSIKDILIFIKNIDDILSEVCLKEIENKIINENLLSYLIITNKENEFLSLIKNISNEKATLSNYTQILFDKEKYYKIKGEKFKIEKEKLFSNNDENNILLKIIDSIYNSNILFLSIQKDNRIYFNELIKYDYYLKYIFDIIPSSKKNILHIILENFDKNVFEIIINKIESKLIENKDEIKDKFIEMINQKDSSYMTPLDILIKEDNNELLYLYTNTINELCNKYLMNKEKLIGKPIKYKIMQFKISLIQYKIDSNYIKKISSDFIQCKKFIQKYKANKKKTELSVKSCPFEEEYEQSKYFINEDCINKTKKILNIIIENNNKIEDEFKIINPKYTHDFIDTKEKLIQLRNEIINEPVLGVDAEFDGEKCGIDGVVCTIQISSMRKTYVVDSLKLHNLIKKYLGDILENENIIKVFHSCDNDLFWILSNFDVKTTNIYDTSRAFAVFQELILNKTFKNANYVSLYHLVVFFLNIKLNKSYQTSNWKLRPLTNAMYQYALNDAKTVLYLYYLFQGFYLYLNKNIFDKNDKYKDYYYNIKKQFFKNRENISLVDADYGDNYYKNCLTKIKMNCLDMIKNRLINNINKINIELDDDEK